MNKRSELSRSDEWETPQCVFDQLCEAYEIFPMIDVSCTRKNNKCQIGFTEEHNALLNDWTECGTIYDIWCNPPHSKTKQFVTKAHEQWLKHNINIMMLVPAGVLCRLYFQEIFEKFVLTNSGVEWHPVRSRPKFINPEQKKQEGARQDYIVIIWRKRINEEGDR